MILCVDVGGVSSSSWCGPNSIIGIFYCTVARFGYSSYYCFRRCLSSSSFQNIVAGLRPYRLHYLRRCMTIGAMVITLTTKIPTMKVLYGLSLSVFSSRLLLSSTSSISWKMFPGFSKWTREMTVRIKKKLRSDSKNKMRYLRLFPLMQLLTTNEWLSKSTMQRLHALQWIAMFY